MLYAPLLSFTEAGKSSARARPLLSGSLVQDIPSPESEIGRAPIDVDTRQPIVAVSDQIPKDSHAEISSAVNETLPFTAGCLLGSVKWTVDCTDMQSDD